MEDAFADDLVDRGDGVLEEEAGEQDGQEQHVGAVAQEFLGDKMDGRSLAM